MRPWTVFVLGCAREPHRDPSPAPAPVVAAADAADAAAAVDAPVAIDAPPAIEGCSAGGALEVAAIDAHEVRYCLSGDAPSCWSFDALTGGPAKPLTLDRAPSSSDPPAITGDEPARVWTTKLDDDKLEVCGPSGCAPFAVVPNPKRDSDEGELREAEASPSGARVAVLRGGYDKMKISVDLYDRASGRRIAVVRPRTYDGEACVYLDGFYGETLVLDERPSCTSRGGARLLVSPAGKVTRIPGFWEPRGGRIAHIGGDLWVFANSSDGDVEVWDFASYRRLAQRNLGQFVLVGGGNDRMYWFEDDKVTIMTPRFEKLATVQPRPCK